MYRHCTLRRVRIRGKKKRLEGEELVVAVQLWTVAEASP